MKKTATVKKPEEKVVMRRRNLSTDAAPSNGKRDNRNSLNTVREENEDEDEDTKPRAVRRGSDVSKKTVRFDNSNKTVVKRTLSLRSVAGPGPTSLLSREEYPMKSKSRGKVIIFNHQFYDDNKPRRGTEIDVGNLRRTLPKLGFEGNDITVHNDLTKDKLLNQLDKLSKNDDSKQWDCLMIFVLTHGLRGKKVCARDYDYETGLLWEPFTADRCKYLAGKPKMFFIIACRGQERLNSVEIAAENETEVDSGADGLAVSYRIPTCADLLLVYSTQPGYVSFREVGSGTWYIQALCHEIRRMNLDTDHMLDLLTRVSRRVAIQYEDSDRKKQCSSFNSMLLHKLYFRTKVKPFYTR